jgi:hypothetical protein
MNLQKELADLRTKPNNIRFNRFLKIAFHLGFRVKGGRGSHVVLSKPNIPEILTIQDTGGRIKPYQVRQFLKILEKYNIEEEGYEHDR